MFEIKTTISTREVEKMLGDLAHKMPSAVARGLTEAAKHTRIKLKERLPRYIDRPTPWTRNSLYFLAAEKKIGLKAAVGFKVLHGKPSWGRGELLSAESMRMQVYGGQRKLKSSEQRLLDNRITSRNKPYLIPAAGVKKNKYGNVTGATMNKILYGGVKMGSASQGFSLPLNGRMAATKRGQLFVKRKGGFGQPQGIFKRVSKRKIVPVFFFASHARYDERFPFYRLANYHSNKVVREKVIESVDVILKKYR